MENKSSELSNLLSFHPAPWKVTYHKRGLYIGTSCADGASCVSGVEDAAGNGLWECTTYSGDGDVVLMSAAAMEALVAHVNFSAKCS